jgi:hypothetical protein
MKYNIINQRLTLIAETDKEQTMLYDIKHHLTLAGDGRDFYMRYLSTKSGLDGLEELRFTVLSKEDIERKVK